MDFFLTIELHESLGLPSFSFILLQDLVHRVSTAKAG